MLCVAENEYRYRHCRDRTYLDVVEDSNEHLVLGHTMGSRIGIIMGTVVYYTIHIEVKAVELGDAVLRNELRDRGIPLAHPAQWLVALVQNMA